MLDRKSIYALNKKDPDAIVYSDVDKHLIRLTRKDFDTEADFLKWKAWSDEEYHAEEKRNHVHANHTLSMEKLADGAVSSDGPEIIIGQRIEKAERERYTAETIIRIKGQLTDKQFRRLWMYFVDGLTTRAIADIEGKTHQGVSKSIRAAKAKILRIFASST